MATSSQDRQSYSLSVFKLPRTFQFIFLALASLNHPVVAQNAVRCSSISRSFNLQS